MRIDARVKARFWSKVQKSNGCWLWIGWKDKDGYGMFDIDHKSYRATHVAWKIYHGEFIQVGVEACHTCDNPACIRKKHLFKGTRLDNVRDMLRKGRCQAPHGTKHWNAKFTEEDILTIRTRYRSGETYSQLARAYNRGVPLIWKIVKRKVWSHV